MALAQQSSDPLTRHVLAAGKQVIGTGKPSLGGPYVLVDHDGRPFSSEQLRGQYSLLYFGFTFCPDICPNELVKMGQVIDLLDKDTSLPRVQPVLISVDPNRDTVAQMRAYIRDFHPRMIGLTGTPQQIKKATKSFRVFFDVVDRVRLIGPSGRSGGCVYVCGILGPWC